MHRMQSNFIAPCDCGGIITSKETGSAVCPKCGNVVTIEWGDIKTVERKAA